MPVVDKEIVAECPRVVVTTCILDGWRVCCLLHLLSCARQRKISWMCKRGLLGSEIDTQKGVERESSETHGMGYLGRSLACHTNTIFDCLNAPAPDWKQVNNALKHQTKVEGLLPLPTHNWGGKCPCYLSTSRASVSGGPQ